MDFFLLYVIFDDIIFHQKCLSEEALGLVEQFVSIPARKVGWSLHLAGGYRNPLYSKGSCRRWWAFFFGMAIRFCRSSFSAKFALWNEADKSLQGMQRFAGAIGHPTFASYLAG